MKNLISAIFALWFFFFVVESEELRIFSKRGETNGSQYFQFNSSDYPSQCNFPSTFTQLTSQQYSEALQTSYALMGAVELLANQRCRSLLKYSLCFDFFAHRKLSVGVGPLCPIDPVTQLPMTCGDALCPPIPICHDFCKHVRQECYPLIDPITDSFIPNCHKYSNDPLIVDGVMFPCINYSHISERVVDCQKHSHLLADTKYGCKESCPSPIYTQSQLSAIYYVQAVLSWLSFLGCTLIFGLLCLDPQYRQLPRRMSVFMGLATLPVSIAGMLPSLSGGLKEVWCDSKSHVFSGQQLEGPLCLAQAVLLQYGTLNTMCWWCMLAVYTSLTIYLGRPLPNWTGYCYHAMGWLFPVPFVATAGALGALGYDNPGTYCFFKPRIPFESETNQLKYPLAFWIIPSSFLLLIGIVATGYLVYILYKEQFKQYKGYLAKFLILQIFLILIFFFLVFAMIFAELLVSSIQTGSRKAESFAFDMCLFLPNATARQCRQADNLNLDFSFEMAVTVFISIQGLMLAFFMLIGANPWKVFQKPANFRSRLSPSIPTQTEQVGHCPSSFIQMSREHV